ncbi:MAG: P-loop NTPase fold protein, partial [Clostridium sp.]
MNLFLDKESRVDTLGYENYARAFSSMIKSEQIIPTPSVIGIHGKWGTGKSSFMELIIKNINPKYYETINNDNDNSKYKILRLNS